MKVGVIADTHGLLRSEAMNALQGCELIIHAGDIGKAEVIERLATLAPLRVIRGNNDLAAPWAAGLPDRLVFELNGWATLLVHDLADVPAELDPAIRLVITGHSHKPRVEWRGECLYLNPGSAGPRRFKLPIGLALLEVTPSAIEPLLVTLSE
jgi:putative phosphoesterase